MPNTNTKPELTAKQIEAGWEHTFSTNNPFCPCDLKSFTKAVNWAERALAATAPNAGAPPAAEALLDRYARAVSNRDRLHAVYMGKAMTDEVYNTFATLRDDTIPALRKELLAHLAAAPAQQAGAPLPLAPIEAWSGWACQYPGRLPRLYGARHIAEVNLDEENGDRLMFVKEVPHD